MKKPVRMSKEAQDELKAMIERTDRLEQQSAQLEACAMTVWSAMAKRFNDEFYRSVMNPNKIR